MLRLRNRGQSLTEYAISIALVALVAVGGLVALSRSLNNGFMSILGNYSPPHASSIPIHATVSGGAQNVANVVATGKGALASSPNIRAQQATVIQVSGSNGGSATVQANSQMLLALAAKYKDTEPALANLIEQLAQKGYSVASSMSYYDKSGGIEDPNNSMGGPNGVCPQYKSLWNQVLQSPEYSNLSADDQTLVNALAEDSYSRASDVFFAGAMQGVGQTPAKNVSASAQVVNSNSQTIHTCSGGACK